MTKLKTLQKPKQQQVPRTALLSFSGMLSLTKTAQQTKQVTKQVSRQVSEPRFQRPFPRPRPTPLKLKLSFASKTKSIAQDILGSDEFQIFIRRKGKDIQIGKASTKQEAAQDLFKSLTSNLGRSGFVTTKGQKIGINEFLGKGFRPSKREKSRVVQESWFSLGSQSERKEIQRARKAKRLKWF